MDILPKEVRPLILKEVPVYKHFILNNVCKEWYQIVREIHCTSLANFLFKAGYDYSPSDLHYKCRSKTITPLLTKKQVEWINEIEW